MITPKCTKCRREIPSDDVNVANDVAYCRNCNLSYQLSDLTFGAEADVSMNLNNPPAGTWLHEDGVETVIGASHRSIGSALGALAICLFWNGIVSVFVILALTSTLRLLGIHLPDWFPAPKMNGETMGTGMTIFLWIFLTPFIVIGTVMIGAVFSFLAGRTEVRISNSQGLIFCGIGSLGWRRRFDASTVKKVRIDESQRNNGQRKECIIIETREGRQIKFGSALPNERRVFMAAATRQALVR